MKRREPRIGCLAWNRRSLAFRAGSFAAEEESWVHEDMCEDYATARLDLASGAVIDLASSWHLHAGRGAVIRAAFYGTHAVAMENKDGFFLDFTLKDSPGPHACDSASHRMKWGGRAAVDWARRLKLCRGYNPGIEQILEVAQALDAIYEHARR